MNHKGAVYSGEHERIVEQELWERVNVKLAALSIHQRGRAHRRQQAPLNALLCCEACGAPMAQSNTTKAGRRYRYYACQGRTAKAGKSCSQGPVAAVDIEASIRKHLAPVLDADLDWGTIHEAVQQVRYEGGRAEL